MKQIRETWWTVAEPASEAEGSRFESGVGYEPRMPWKDAASFALAVTGTTLLCLAALDWLAYGRFLFSFLY